VLALPPPPYGRAIVLVPPPLARRLEGPLATPPAVLHCCCCAGHCSLAQVLEVPDAGKDELQGAWKQWMQEAGA
jgi:hypothetical protein